SPSISRSPPWQIHVDEIAPPRLMQAPWSFGRHETSGGKIGRNGPQEWPPRSPYIRRCALPLPRRARLLLELTYSPATDCLRRPPCFGRCRTLRREPTMRIRSLIVLAGVLGGVVFGGQACVAEDPPREEPLCPNGFVQSLYANVLGRKPAAAELATWEGHYD